MPIRAYYRRAGVGAREALSGSLISARDTYTTFTASAARAKFFESAPLLRRAAGQRILFLLAEADPRIAPVAIECGWNKSHSRDTREP